MTSTFRDPIKVVADILAHEMELPVGQLALEDEKWNIPQNGDIYMALQYSGPSKPICNFNELDTSVTPPQERQQITSLLEISIDIMSFGEAARFRKEEIPMALMSIFSQQWQEKYQCKIAMMPSPFINVSMLEGVARLKRFRTTISVTALFTKIKDAAYYEVFPTPEVITNV